MSETPLAGGDVNVGAKVVVRVGDTVRRPVGPHTPVVHARILCDAYARRADLLRFLA